jgi:hypothetical protein
MRQFDVFVLEKDNPNFSQWKPEFEDPALGWFHDSDWNSSLQKIDSEWVVFSHPSVTIDRDFLNNLAECVEGFPMVDAFAPRLKYEGHFYGGHLLNGAKGFAPISENEKMRFVAAPNPFIGVFSSRIIQRTGLFDQTLPPEFRLLDYTLRMAHAGGKMFSVPYLVAQIKNELNEAERLLVNGEFLQAETSIRPEWQIIYKNMNVSSLLGFSLRHLRTLPLFFNTKELKFKRDKATALSKFSEKYLKEITL